MANHQYQADYLKVTVLDRTHPVEDIASVIRTHSEQFNKVLRSDKADPKGFGFFDEKLRTDDWALLKFHPYSVDCGISQQQTLYQTRDQSLNAAIQYLGDNGYHAKPIDLERMIDNS
ncbi:MAG: hypothetical protein ACQESG_04455 [Nanobdellota archaeon]